MILGIYDFSSVNDDYRGIWRPRLKKYLASMKEIWPLTVDLKNPDPTIPVTHMLFFHEGTGIYNKLLLELLNMYSSTLERVVVYDEDLTVSLPSHLSRDYLVRAAPVVLERTGVIPLYAPYFTLLRNPRPPGVAKRASVCYMQDQTDLDIRSFLIHLELKWPQTFSEVGENDIPIPVMRQPILNHTAISLVETPAKDVIPATVMEALHEDSIAIVLSYAETRHQIVADRYTLRYGIPALKPEYLEKIIRYDGEAYSLYTKTLETQHTMMRRIADPNKWVSTILGE